MLNRIDIHDMVPHQTYAKGLQIYAKGKNIVDFEVKENCITAETDEVHAEVAGSKGNLYYVYGEYNLKEDDLRKIKCTCPAFNTYPGPCKHCVAVLLRYTDYLREEPQYEDFRRTGALSRQPEAYRRRPQTTGAIKELLGREVLQRTVPVLQRDIYGKVRLEPELNFADGKVTLQFRIGIDHMYVMKDVYEFAELIKRKEEFSYGKKLKFIHTTESFEPSSRQLAEFIVLWTKNNKGRSAGESFRSYINYGQKPNNREIALNGVELEEFARAMGESEFCGTAENYSAKTWHFEDGSPKLSMEIETVENGISVRADYRPFIRGINHYYCFEEGKILRIPIDELAPIEDFLRCLKFLPNNRFFVERDDIPAFCRELLPKLKKLYACDDGDFDESRYGIIPVSFKFYLDAPGKDCVVCRAMSVYGEKEYNLNDRSSQVALRDMVQEAETVTLAESVFDDVDEVSRNLILDGGDEKIYDFLTRGIELLKTLGTVYISDTLKNMQIKPAPTVSVGVSLSGDLLNLTLTGEDISKSDLIDVLTRYDKKKKYHRLKNGDFIRIQDEGIEKLISLKDELGLTAKQLTAEYIELPRYRALYLDRELGESDKLPVERNKYFRELINNMKTAEDSGFKVPLSLKKILRTYQKRGFLWLKTLARNGFGGILADDMGLGKTLQVIAFLLSEHQEKKREDRKPSLIICPASLVYNWESEVCRFAPELSVRLIVGNADERKALIGEIAEDDVVITSYELLRRDIEAYEEIRFACQVIDEAQYIKNPKTQSAKSVKQIKAGFKLALTGTPVENRLSELWSIFDYLMPGFLFGYERFRREFEIPVAVGQEEEPLKRLQKMIAPFVLRRLKGEVLHDLPEKIEENRYTRLEGEQQKLYDAHVKELQLLLNGQSEEEFNTSKIQVLSALTRLRQICCDPGLVFEGYKGGSNKTEMCMDLISNAVDGGHKILLFSQFTTMLDRLKERLDKEKISYYMLNGATPKAQRMELVKNFNTDGTSVFLISLKAGGTGLNLTSADIVIHFDPWWNIAVQNQATDRAHRIGQKKAVNVYKLIARGTIEENILKLQEQKKDLAEQLLSGSGMGAINFSREDLLALL